MVKIKQPHICIVGAALNGLFAALILSKLNVRITLIDQNDLDSFENPRFDGRTTAISYGSSQFIKTQLPGLWSELSIEAAPINDIYITHNLQPGCLHYGPQESNHNAMGYIVHNQTLRKKLYQALSQCPSIEFTPACSISDMTFDPSGYVLKLSNQQQLKCYLVIGADGAKSSLRQHLGIRVKNLSYDQTALTFLVRHSEPHEGRAFEHFTPDGPLAFLPLLDPYQSSVVWSLNNDIAHQHQKLVAQELAAVVNKVFQETLGDLDIISTVHDYPLFSTLPVSYIAPRAVLIGDAAHVIHPVAGQGFNLGLRDIQQLYQTIQEALSTGLDIGSSTLLSQYQKSRRIDVLSMTGFTHGMVRLFSNDNAILNIIRGQGLRLVGNIGPLKKLLARRAMGLNLFS